MIDKIQGSALQPGKGHSPLQAQLKRIPKDRVLWWGLGQSPNLHIFSSASERYLQPLCGVILFSCFERKASK